MAPVVALHSCCNPCQVPPIPLVAYPDLVSSATRDLDPSILHHLPSLAFSRGTSGLVWGLRKPRKRYGLFCFCSFWHFVESVICTSWLPHPRWMSLSCIAYRNCADLRRARVIMRESILLGESIGTFHFASFYGSNTNAKIG